MKARLLHKHVANAIDLLHDEDRELYDLLEDEYERQSEVLTMVAASSIAHPSALICESMAQMNVTAEGYPGARFHAGCRVIDKIEQLAIDRAKHAFKAQYANVQVHSATTANQIVMCSVMQAGDTLLGMDLNCGGHLTHGAKPSISGQYFDAVGYGINDSGDIEYDHIQALAEERRPKLIICGTTAYPRFIDFKRFREIADSVGAYLLADITHIAGLVVAGLHPSPIDHAHFTTTCTHKQLFGVRGGLILIGKEHETLTADGKFTLAQLMQKGVFPFFQGAPNLNQISAKARGFDLVLKPEFREMAKRITGNAKALAKWFVENGYLVVTGGTDNHLVVVDVLSKGITGFVAEKALEECNIVVNKNRIPGDQKSAFVTSGIRIGANSMAMKGMESDLMPKCGDLIHRVLSNTKAIDDRKYEIAAGVKESVQLEVRELCKAYPIPAYVHTGDVE